MNSPEIFLKSVYSSTLKPSSAIILKKADYDAAKIVAIFIAMIAKHLLSLLSYVLLFSLMTVLI